jgi:hypothetical protein
MSLASFLGVGTTNDLGTCKSPDICQSQCIPATRSASLYRIERVYVYHSQLPAVRGIYTPSRVSYSSRLKW